MHDAVAVVSVHVKFSRGVMDVKKSINSAALYGELGRIFYVISWHGNH